MAPRIPQKGWPPGFIRALQVLVIFVAGWWIFWPALRGDWLWDDGMDITQNPVIGDASGLWSIWFQPGSQIDYYPVKASVQWLQWHLWGNDTLGYHLTNVVLHFVNALLVWRLFRKFGLRLAWLGALLFTIHPVMVESVAWIAELKNTLSTPPFLLAMCAYMDYDEHHRWRDYLPALGLFLVAMLCKTTMVMFPVVILLYAWWKRGRISWSDLKASAPFLLISLALGVLTLFVGTWYEQLHHKGVHPVPLGGLLSRMALVGTALSFYFSKAVLPVGLVPIYRQWVVNPPSPIQFLPLPVLGAVLYALWLKRGSWGRHALLGFGFFLIMLAPLVSLNVGGFATFTWVMDHFLYVPILGLIGLAIAGLGQVEAQLAPVPRRCVRGILSVVMVLMAWGSHAYASVFTSEEALWTYTLARNPDVWFAPAHNNLGTALGKKGDLAAAMIQFQKALAIDFNIPDVHFNRGVLFAQIGRPTDAITEYQTTLELDPTYAKAHNNMGVVLGQMGSIDEAMAQYREALKIDPNLTEARNNLDALLSPKRQLDAAIARYEHALALNPRDFETFNELGLVLTQEGRIDEAITGYQMALNVSPNFAQAHNNLGIALAQTGRMDEAIAHFQKAVAIDPAFAKAHYNLGLAFFKKGNIAGAKSQLEQAVRLQPDFTDAKNSLAKLKMLSQSISGAR